MRTAYGSDGRVTSRLDAGQAVAGVGGKEPGQVLGLGEGCAVREGAAEVLAEGGTDIASKGAGLFEPGLELVLRPGEPEGLKPGWVARGVPAEEDEVAGVGDEHEAVPGPVAADLGAVGGKPRVVAGWFDLDDTAFGELALARCLPFCNCLAA